MSNVMPIKPGDLDDPRTLVNALASILAHIDDAQEAATRLAP
jgi:hypothetical protein